MFNKAMYLFSCLMFFTILTQADCIAPQQKLIDQKREKKAHLSSATSEYISIFKSPGSAMGCQRNCHNDVIILMPNASEAFEVSGLNKTKYDLKKNVYGLLGYPLNGEMNTTDNKGRFNKFEGGEIYYHNGANESFIVLGSIAVKWKKLGGVTSTLGYPITDETPTPDQVGRYKHFDNGSIYYRPCIGGAFQITGLIRTKWAQLGSKKSYLGYPLSDELPTEDG